LCHSNRPRTQLRLLKVLSHDLLDLLESRRWIEDRLPVETSRVRFRSRKRELAERKGAVAFLLIPRIPINDRGALRGEVPNPRWHVRPPPVSGVAEHVADHPIGSGELL